VKPYDFDSLVDIFLGEIRQANQFGNTAATYKTALDELGRWLDELPAVAAVEAPAGGGREIVKVPAAIDEMAELRAVHLNAFIRHLQTRHQLPGGHHGRSSRAGRKLAPATVSNRYRAISSFVNWMYRRDEFAGPSPMAQVPAPALVETAVEVYGLEDLQALIAVCGTGKNRSFLDVRDEAILRVFCEAGSRRGETAGVLVRDVNCRKKELRFEGWTTQGNRERNVYFGNKTRLSLERYLHIRPKHRHADLPQLWLAPKGALTKGGLYQMIRRRGAQAGLALHPHQLRHSFANLYLEQGGLPENLKEIGGWESDAAMKIYTRHRAAQRAKAEHEALGLGELL
jgi:site-specific recombinase XerD